MSNGRSASAWWVYPWAFWLLISGMDWFAKGRSPLVWPNIWGLLEWLSWTSFATAISCIAFNQLGCSLPGTSRKQDLRAIALSAGQWLAGLAVVTGFTALRFKLYVADTRPDYWQAVQKILASESGLWLAVLFAVPAVGPGLIFIAWRMLRTLTRAYAE